MSGLGLATSSGVIGPEISIVGNHAEFFISRLPKEGPIVSLSFLKLQLINCQLASPVRSPYEWFIINVQTLLVDIRVIKWSTSRIQTWTTPSHVCRVYLAQIYFSVDFCWMEGGKWPSRVHRSPIMHKVWPRRRVISHTLLCIHFCLWIRGVHQIFRF